MEKKLKIIHSFLLSAAVIIIFITAITIVADLQPTLKSWLKNTFFHHWVGKSILASILFPVIGSLFYFLPLKSNEEKIRINLLFLFWISLFGTIALFIFYIYETFFIH